jgi:hypothetical protein
MELVPRCVAINRAFLLINKCITILSSCRKSKATKHLQEAAAVAAVPAEGNGTPSNGSAPTPSKMPVNLEQLPHIACQAIGEANYVTDVNRWVMFVFCRKMDTGNVNMFSFDRVGQGHTNIHVYGVSKVRK